MPASAGTLNIAITATNKATAQIEAINKQLAAMRAPAERMQKAMARFGELSGLTKVATGFQRIARAGLDAFRSVARIVEPLAAITGAASLAGMYRLVSAWGEWGSRLGFAAQRIGINATRLQSWQGAAQLAGTSAQGLTSGLQNLGQTMYDAVGGRNPAAVMMFNQLGVAFKKDATHARSVTEVLPELADKIAGLKDPYAQAQAAAVFFGGSTEDMLPFLRRGSAGIAELTDKAIRYGVMSQGAVDAANRMREAHASLTLAVTGLGNSIAEKLAPVISPLLTQMADWIAANRDWIATGIGDQVRQFATWVQQIDFARIERDAEALWHTADHVAQAFGGWKPVLEGLAVFMATSWVAKMTAPILSVLRLLALVPGSGVSAAGLAAAAPGLAVAGLEVAAVKGADYLVDRGGEVGKQEAVRGGHQTALGQWIYDHSSSLRWLDNKLWGSGQNARQANPLTAAQQQANAAQAMAYFQSQGWSAQQAAGLAANISRESGFNEKATGDNGQAFGIGQWHADRQAQFEKQFGHSIRTATFKEQLAFMDWELHHTEAKAGMRLAGAQSAVQAGQIVSRYYERPGDADGEAWRRGALAQQFASLPAPAAAPAVAPTTAPVAALTAVPAAAAPAAAVPSAPPATLNTGSDSVATVRGSADLNIRLDGFPPGTKTTATTKGDLFNTPRIASGLTTAFAGP